MDPQGLVALIPELEAMIARLDARMARNAETIASMQRVFEKHSKDDSDE